MPFPMKYELTNTSKHVQAFEKLLQNKRNAVQLKEMGLKCVVSDYAIAHWYAQSLKLDVNNLPNEPTEPIKYLKRLEKSRVQPIAERELNEHIKKSRNKGMATQSGELNDMIALELERKEKENEKKDAGEIMRKMKPL